MSYYLNGIFLITFLGGTLASEIFGQFQPIPHPDCPRIDDINHAVIFSYPQDCSMYYSCSNGVAYPKKCPINLYWSSRTYRCDYIENSDCQYTPGSSYPTQGPLYPTVGPLYPDTFYPSPQPSYPLPGGSPVTPFAEYKYEPYPNDCNKYYICEVKSCPINFSLNPYTKQCELSHLAGCENRQSPIGGPDLNELCRRTPQQYVPYPEDSHKFIHCGEAAQVYSCPDNLCWNVEHNSCDHSCAFFK